MKPLTVSIEVPNSPEQVYEYLDVIGNHEQFTDHFLVDWQLSGPKRGLGAKANVRANVIGERDRTDFEIVEVDSDRRIARPAKAARDLPPRCASGWRYEDSLRARVPRASPARAADGTAEPDLPAAAQREVDEAPGR